MSMTELRNLSPTEKLKIIEVLWSDLAADEDAFPSPAWHEQELRQTEAEFTAGRLEILDWENAKAELRTRCSHANDAPYGFQNPATRSG